LFSCHTGTDKSNLHSSPPILSASANAMPIKARQHSAHFCA